MEDKIMESLPKDFQKPQEPLAPEEEGQETDLQYYLFVHNIEEAILKLGHALNLFTDEMPPGIHKGVEFCQKRLISLTEEIERLDVASDIEVPDPNIS
jgi:hypothetical protein